MKIESKETVILHLLNGIKGLKTLHSNILKVLLKKKKIRPEDLTEEQNQRFYERRFVELGAISNKIQRIKKRWWD